MDRRSSSSRAPSFASNIASIGPFSPRLDHRGHTETRRSTCERR
ncbi:hypothetical protein [Methylobacterium sp. 17Sr1-1]|nr:hypothetical protein [Methylobacterium sp. 17Sr1-1]